MREHRYRDRLHVVGDGVVRPRAAAAPWTAGTARAGRAGSTPSRTGRVLAARRGRAATTYAPRGRSRRTVRTRGLQRRPDLGVEHRSHRLERIVGAVPGRSSTSTSTAAGRIAERRGAPPKRSSCASGSGYVPWKSTGFWVAITRNGPAAGRGPVDRDLRLADRLEQRRPACAGSARLISSGEQHVGDDRTALNENDPSRGSKMDEPRMSAGNRSGVNCTRLKSAGRRRARLLASMVLPTPGTSSSRRWPPVSSASTVNVDRLILAQDDAADVRAQAVHHRGGRDRLSRRGE